MNQRQLQVASNDTLVFECICEYALDNGGQGPRVVDLVEMVSEKIGRRMWGGTITQSIRRLSEMGLIITDDSSQGIRTAGYIRVANSRFYIDITTQEVERAVAKFHEERKDRRRNSKE